MNVCFHNLCESKLTAHYFHAIYTDECQKLFQLIKKYSTRRTLRGTQGLPWEGKINEIS